MKVALSWEWECLAELRRSHLSGHLSGPHMAAQRFPEPALPPHTYWKAASFGFIRITSACVIEVLDEADLNVVIHKRLLVSGESAHADFLVPVKAARQGGENSRNAKQVNQWNKLQKQ